jgi:hypothetical protein
MFIFIYWSRHSSFYDFFFVCVCKDLHSPYSTFYKKKTARTTKGDFAAKGTRALADRKQQEKLS